MAGTPANPCTTNQVYSLVGLWLQFIFYGAYVALFLSAFARIVKNRTQPSKIFIVGNGILFLLTTLDSSIKLYTVIYAHTHPFVQGESNACAQARWGRWDTFSSAVLLNLVIWIMDILVIHRCFIIWNRKWLVISLPCFMLAGSFAINTVLLAWFAHPDTVYLLPKAITVFRRMCYPVSLAVNILTTGLIAYAILRQHFESVGTGARLATGGLSLFYVTRVIVESALFYTLQILVLSILHLLKHPAVTIFQSTLTPSVGITFALMAVRIDFARNETAESGVRSGFTFVSWRRGSEIQSTDTDDSEITSEARSKEVNREVP